MKTLSFLAAALAILAGAPRAAGQGGEIPLRKGDRITVSIGGVPDNDAAQIKGMYTISDAGMVNLLHIGEIRAAGLKPSMLQRAIEQTYIREDFYLNPNVLVSIDDAARQVFVTGVQKPGAFAFRQDMTLSQAIQAGGGPGTFSRMDKVKLIRAGRTSIHNLKTGMGDPAVDVILQPNDQINIPEK